MSFFIANVDTLEASSRIRLDSLGKNYRIVKEKSDFPLQEMYENIPFVPSEKYEIYHAQRIEDAGFYCAGRGLRRTDSMAGRADIVRDAEGYDARLLQKDSELLTAGRGQVWRGHTSDALHHGYGEYPAAAGLCPWRLPPCSGCDHPHALLPVSR